MLQSKDLACNIFNRPLSKILFATHLPHLHCNRTQCGASVAGSARGGHREKEIFLKYLCVLCGYLCKRSNDGILMENLT